MFSDLTPPKFFYSYRADGQQSFQKYPKINLVSPPHRWTVCCPTEIQTIFVGVWAGLGPFLSKPTGRAARGNSQSFFPVCMNTWDARQNSWTTNITFGMETIEPFLQQGKKKNLYLWSDFPIFGGKVSLSHYPQACCGIQFQWCLAGEAWGLEESKAAAVWVGLEPCPWYGGLFMLSSRCPLQQGLSCT